VDNGVHIVYLYGVYIYILWTLVNTLWCNKSQWFNGDYIFTCCLHT